MTTLSPLSTLITSDQALTNASELLKELANENRVRILAIISQSDEISVNDLQKQLGVLSQSALSQHLAILRQSGTVKTRRQSQSIFYSLGNPLVSEILSMIIASNDRRDAMTA